MRIVVDLQGAQSTGSRKRGIGRYSLALAKAMAANAQTHDVWIALSGFYPDTIEPLRAAFDGLVPQRQIVLWEAPGPVAKLEPSSQWRMETGELAREAFLAGLKPDIVHVSSLFEGLTDDVLTSIGSFDSMLPTAVTLYDLIPLIHRDEYLADAMVEAWYERKLGALRRAQLWLAISESSRRDGIDLLGLPEEWVVNVSTAADPMFRPVEISADGQRDVLRRFEITRPFLLYTGGIDRRKNIEALIGAYAKLPAAVRTTHHLAIVCSATADQVNRLRRLARQRGLSRDELIVTGFVSDNDLLMLYNLCKAFVFPSWHEGFGLPVLEAMSCGAAVIGAGTSSVPEVIARRDALFDPHDQTEIAAKLHAVLTDEAFRQDLRRYALPQALKFSWDRTARNALAAMERLHRRDHAIGVGQAHAPPRHPRLAYVSPLPPERSGIADYSAELLPELARHYDIEVVVNQAEVRDRWVRANLPVRTAEWFEQNADWYDRVLYHFGNSAFHTHMFGLLERHPGVVVLHDFFLSGVLAYMERTRYASDAWSKALFASHGYGAIMERFAASDPTDVVFKYPANLAVLQQADGIIVHSDFSRDLANRWYGSGLARDWRRVAALRGRPVLPLRRDARTALAFRDDDFLVCSFGMMGSTKLNQRLLKAWLASPLPQDERCHLIFIGERDSGQYGGRFADIAARSPFATRIHVAGFAEQETYFRYLAAADVAVQLRVLSRGETSRTILDCMRSGLPTIVNAIGAAAELPSDCVVGLLAEFTGTELQEALVKLRRDRLAAAALGERAATHVRTHHNPRAIADQYHEAIEGFARTGPHARQARLARRIAAVRAVTPPTDKDWLNLARCIAQNRTVYSASPRQWLLDVTGVATRGPDDAIARALCAITLAWINEAPATFHVEPIARENGIYRYARTFAAGTMQIDAAALLNEPVETRPGDVFVALGHGSYALPPPVDIYAAMRRRGVLLYFVLPDAWTPQPEAARRSAADGIAASWLTIVAELADGVVSSSAAAADRLAARLDAMRPARRRSLQIGWIPLAADGVESFPRAKQLAALILGDRWHAIWSPDRGIGPEQAHTDRESSRAGLIAGE